MASKDYVIDDTSKATLWTPPSGYSTGLELGFRGPKEYEYGEQADPFPAELCYDESEWQARIQEKNERKDWLRDLLELYGVGPKDQNGTNYCWIFGPVRAFEIIRLKQGEEHISLSPASAGAQIKRGANQGGWGKEGLQWISKYGLAKSSDWKDTQINGWQGLAAQTKDDALNYRCTEWWELRPRNLKELVSCLLRGIPVAVGYNWWGHEVCAVGLRWNNGTVELLILNSWGMWGDKGYGWLAGSKILPDDAVAPRVAIAL